jgi:hypothetical protein
MLDEQVDIASRHEEMRQQAEERRRKIVAMRATLMNMSPEERMAYLEEHRDELFGEEAAPQPPARPRMMQPSMRDPMRPPVPPVPPRY